MDPNRSSKRRGFTKSKLLTPFYRAAKPKPTSSFEFAANQPKAPPPSPSVGLIIVNQDQVFSNQKTKVAFVVPERNAVESYGKLENFYCGAAEDEAVDAKAARYISSVRERFCLERTGSERKNIEDMQL